MFEKDLIVIGILSLIWHLSFVICRCSEAAPHIG